ncbi:unnamed protein product [Trifolium pratense]|uniref:Uncharacterized protein n=1 Tax=Trifolium pratense TaxID=57577 RepID=A0ACB0LR85_TRIPR|nr:unnamed protein product [Trifolium pratense]
MNEEELFNQLFKARLGHSPYDKYDGWKERGYAGPVALQYGEDLTALGITNDTKFWLLQNCNPNSVEYIALVNQPLQTRLDYFRRLLEQAAILEAEGSSHPC